jgi:hypothetical protein
VQYIYYIIFSQTLESPSEDGVLTTLASTFIGTARTFPKTLGEARDLLRVTCFPVWKCDSLNLLEP